MSEQIVNFGKHKGKTFEQLLMHDINYCTWVASLKFTNEFNKEFVEWLRSGSLARRLNEVSREKLQKAIIDIN